MAALQAGDDSALADLMSRWELPVKAFLLRLGVPSQSVEDIAQEAFVRLYEKRDRFKPGCAFKPWLLTLAGNLGRNALRWKSRHPTESLDSSGPEGDASRDLPDPAGRSPSESAVPLHLPGASNLSATGRFSSGSRARNTTPMPPRPSTPSDSNLPTVAALYDPSAGPSPLCGMVADS